VYEIATETLSPRNDIIAASGFGLLAMTRKVTMTTDNDYWLSLRGL